MVANVKLGWTSDTKKRTPLKAILDSVDRRSNITMSKKDTIKQAIWAWKQMPRSSLVSAWVSRGYISEQQMKDFPVLLYIYI